LGVSFPYILFFIELLLHFSSVELICVLCSSFIAQGDRNMDYLTNTFQRGRGKITPGRSFKCLSQVECTSKILTGIFMLLRLPRFCPS